MIEAVLFDYGGVLTDGGTGGSTDRAVAEFFAIDPSAVDLGDLHNSYGRGQIGTDEFIDGINHRYGQAKTMLAEDYVFLNSDIYQLRIIMHALGVKLRGQGIRTGILSNINGLIADQLAEIGAYDGFDPVILSHQVGLRKPEPEIYQLALERLGLEPESVVFVDDKPKNLEPAHKLGIITVHAHSGKQLGKAIPAMLARINGTEITELD